jgi:hypothetical protein
VSRRAETLVWERSRAKGSNLLVLLHLADCAQSDGRDAWPGVPAIAAAARLSQRGARYILHRLERDGEIVVELNSDGRAVEIGSRRVQPAWFIHLRCVCDFDAYQAQPQQEKFATTGFPDGRRRQRQSLPDDRKTLHDNGNGLSAKPEKSRIAYKEDPSEILERDPRTEIAREGHRRHAFCPPRGDGFCVPAFLHQEFDAMLGIHGPEFDLLAWYVETDKRRRQEQPTVGDPLAWWRDGLRAEMQRRGWLIPRGVLRDRRADATVASGSTCPHPTRCATISACIERTIREGRAARAAGAVS